MSKSDNNRTDSPNLKMSKGDNNRADSSDLKKSKNDNNRTGSSNLKMGKSVSQADDNEYHGPNNIKKNENRAVDNPSSSKEMPDLGEGNELVVTVAGEEISGIRYIEIISL